MRWIIACAACFAGASSAQELPSLEAAVSEFAGTEVEITGTIIDPGRGWPTYYLKSGETLFTAEPALPRDALAQIEGCPSDIAHGLCTVTVNAEVKVEEDRIVLVMYEITNFSRN